MGKYYQLDVAPFFRMCTEVCSISTFYIKFKLSFQCKLGISLVLTANILASTELFHNFFVHNINSICSY